MSLFSKKHQKESSWASYFWRLLSNRVRDSFFITEDRGERNYYRRANNFQKESAAYQTELIIEQSRACLHLGTTFYKSMETFIISDILKYTSIRTSSWMFIRYIHSNIALKIKLKGRDLKVSPNIENMGACHCWIPAWNTTNGRIQ